MVLSAGTRLGPYEILEPLGAGRMGEVYRATDTRLDRTVAVKVLPGELAADPQLKARFEREQDPRHKLLRIDPLVIRRLGRMTPPPPRVDDLLRAGGETEPLQAHRGGRGS